MPCAPVTLFLAMNLGRQRRAKLCRRLASERPSTHFSSMPEDHVLNIRPWAQCAGGTPDRDAQAAAPQARRTTDKCALTMRSKLTASSTPNGRRCGNRPGSRWPARGTVRRPYCLPRHGLSAQGRLGRPTRWCDFVWQGVESGRFHGLRTMCSSSAQHTRHYTRERVHTLW